jgi:glycosyltransferase involved in cell wall biosynthesis
MSGPVLQLNTQAGWRGGEQQTLHLARGMAGERIIVGRAGSELLRRASKEGLAVESLPSDRGVLGVLALRRLVRRLKPSVVHAHASKAHQLARLAMMGIRVPLVVTRRVEFPLSRGAVTRWKYCAGIAAYGAISNSVRDALMKGGVDGDRVHVIPSAADFGSIDATLPAKLTELDLPEDAFIVLHAGALNPQKNQDMLLRVWAALEHRYSHVHLLIAGAGEREAELRSLASELSLTRVHWLGFRSDITGVMKCASLFLNTSRFEGLCSSLIQVRRCDVPVVATAVGGVPEIIEHEVSGLLVPLDDVDAMVKEASRVIDDRDMQRVRAGIREGMDRFSVDHMCTAYERLYDAVRSQ